MTNTDGIVTYESTQNIAILTMSRPAKLNSINRSLAASLEEAFQRFDQSDDSVAILRGEGERAFTAGADLTDPPLDGYGYVPNIGVRVRKPFICAISGWCIGVGLALLQQADLAVATEDARFRYPEPDLGITRGLMASLVGRIPHKIAVELVLVGNDMTASCLHDYGLINVVTSYDQLLPAALELATRIASHDDALNVFLKQCIDDTLPKGPGEIAEHIRWLGNQLPGNRALFERVGLRS
jgi:enoyl-CoA hydratase